MKMFYIVLVFNFFGFLYCAGSINAPLNLHLFDKEVTCDPTTVMMFQGDDLNLNTNYERNISRAWCSYNKENISVSSYKRSKEYPEANITIHIPNVTTEMSAVWNCTFLSLPGTFIQRRTYYKNISFAAADCLINLHIAKPLQQVIAVNNVRLQMKPSAAGVQYGAEGSYEYNDEDLVDVTCANLHKENGLKCNTLKMYYKLIDKNGLVPVSTLRGPPTDQPTGFKIRMTSAHDNTVATCICNTNKTSTVALIYFNMKKMAIIDDDTINVYINGLAVNPTTTKLFTGVAINKQLIYETYEENDLHITFENAKSCHNPVGDFKCERISCTILIRKQDLDKDVTITCIVNKNSVQIVFNRKKIIKAQPTCYLNSYLKINEKNVTKAVEIHDGKQRIFIYKPEDAMYTLLCNAYCTQIMSTNINLFGSGDKRRAIDKVDTKSKSILVNITKTDILEDRVFKCVLRDNYENGPVYANITVVFENIVPVSTASSNIDTASSDGIASNSVSTQHEETSINWPIVGAGSMGGLVFICAVIVIFRYSKLKNHKRASSDVIYENLEPNDSPIPPFPRQWESHYAEPVDRLADATYSVPCINKSVEDLYSKPVPKGLRNCQNRTEDLTYAEIMTNSTSKKDLNFMYGQVIPKNNRGRNLNDSEYANMKEEPCYAQVVAQIPKYENTESESNTKASDYVEPAYCEVRNWK